MHSSIVSAILPKEDVLSLNAGFFSYYLTVSHFSNNGLPGNIVFC